MGEECNGCDKGGWSVSTIGNCCRLLSAGFRLLITSNLLVAWDPVLGGLSCSFVKHAPQVSSVGGAALDCFEKQLAVSADGRGCVRWRESLECHTHDRFLFVV